MFGCYTHRDERIHRLYYMHFTAKGCYFLLAKFSAYWCRQCRVIISWQKSSMFWGRGVSVMSWLTLTVVWRAVVDVTWQTATLSRHAGPCCDAERQQDQCQASAAVVTLAANPWAHQTQSRHSDVQGSSDVITAVPKFAAERSHPVTYAPTFQHAAPDRAENAHWTCQASVLRCCTFSVEQSAGRCCWY